MGVITAVANLKGGVGKTFVTGQLAHAAAVSGRRCLIVDADMQGNSTKHFIQAFTRTTPPDKSLADVIDRGIALSAADAIWQTARPEIDLLPSGFEALQAVQDTLVGKPGGEMALARALREVRDSYDHIFIDCRPAIDLISRGALYAADNVIAVVQPESDALDGLAGICQAIDEIAEYMDKVLPVAGIVVNLLDSRRGDHVETLEHVRAWAAEAGIPMLGHPIPQYSDLSRLSNVGLGVDQHPKPGARWRVIAQNFTEILNSLEPVGSPA